MKFMAFQHRLWMSQILKVRSSQQAMAWLRFVLRPVTPKIFFTLGQQDNEEKCYGVVNKWRHSILYPLSSLRFVLLKPYYCRYFITRPKTKTVTSFINDPPIQKDNV